MISVDRTTAKIRARIKHAYGITSGFLRKMKFAEIIFLRMKSAIRTPAAICTIAIENISEAVNIIIKYQISLSRLGFAEFIVVFVSVELID